MAIHFRTAILHQLKQSQKNYYHLILIGATSSLAIAEKPRYRVG